MKVMIPLVTASAIPEKPNSFAAPPPLTACWMRSTTWYFRSRKAEPAAARRDVVDVAGERVREVVHLVDERRNEQGADRHDPEQHAEHREDHPRPSGS